MHNTTIGDGKKLTRELLSSIRPTTNGKMAQSQPQLAASLLARFLQLRKTMMVPNGPPAADGAVAQPAAAVGPCDKLRETGFWQPWESGA